MHTGEVLMFYSCELPELIAADSVWMQQQVWEKTCFSCCLWSELNIWVNIHLNPSSLSLHLAQFFQLCYGTTKLFVFWTLLAKQLGPWGGMEGWDHPAAASSPALTPTSSLHSLLYSSCSCSLFPLSFSASVIETFSPLFVLETQRWMEKLLEGAAQ